MIYTIIIGAIVGYLAGRIMKGGGYGVIINTALGILGGIVGNLVLGAISGLLTTKFIGGIIKGVIGAIIILFIAEVIKKDDKPTKTS